MIMNNRTVNLGRWGLIRSYICVGCSENKYACSNHFHILFISRIIHAHCTIEARNKKLIEDIIDILILNNFALFLAIWQQLGPIPFAKHPLAFSFAGEILQTPGTNKPQTLIFFSTLFFLWGWNRAIDRDQKWDKQRERERERRKREEALFYSPRFRIY